MDEIHTKSKLEILQETVLFLENLLRTSADGVVITDATQNIIMANDKFCAIFERERRDVLETNLLYWLEQIDFIAVRKWAELEKSVFHSGFYHDMELQIRTGTGGHRYFSINASRAQQASLNDNSGIISIWRDITGYKCMEKELNVLNDTLEQRVAERTEELRKSEERYHRLIETANDAIICDINGIIVDWNKSAERVFGYSSSEAVGMPVEIIIPDDCKKQYREELAYFLKTGKAKSIKRAIEEYRITKDCTRVPVDVSVTAQKIQEGRYCFMSIFRDMTEWKKIQKTLLQSEKLSSLGMMASGVAHDFNNILSIISGKTQLLKIQYEDHEKLIEDIRVIKEATDDGAEIVERMRKFTLTNNDTSHFVSVNILEILKQAIEFSRHRWMNMARASGISYTIDETGMKNIPNIMGNPSELREVFINIINNALDAMIMEGSLSFCTWTEDNTVAVSISDSGWGMTDEVKKQIFDPFFTTKLDKGSGLGMSIVYSIVTGHGGTIDVDSTVKKGTTFTLKFPAARGVVKKTSETEKEENVLIKKLRILIVDDEADICNILDRYFRHGGHEVKITTVGIEALQMLKAECFDLLLCDLIMPDLSGYDVIKYLDILDKRPKVGIITGWAKKLEEESNECLSSRVDFIIQKPFDLSELSRYIYDTFSG